MPQPNPSRGLSRRGCPAVTCTPRSGSPGFHTSPASTNPTPRRLKLPTGTGPTNPSWWMNGKRNSLFRITTREPTRLKSGYPRSVAKPPTRKTWECGPPLAPARIRVANE